MTTKNFSMMVIGMMILGTVNTFGKTNTNVHNDRNMGHNPRTECNLRHMHDGHCEGTPMVDRNKIYPGMDRFMVNHILDGRHIFNHHGECKVCHMDRHEIKKVERELRHNTPVTPRPVGRTSHFGR